jgi:hypothetical protein
MAPASPRAMSATIIMCLVNRAGTLKVPGNLPQQRVAVVEVGADHQVRVIELAGDQPAVVPPLT